MKKILLLCAMLGMITVTRAQLSFEHTYNHAYFVSVFNIEDEGHKYVCFDTLVSSVNVYNPNHTLWRSVPVNLPNKLFNFFQVQWVSKHLFNSDDKVEFVISYPTKVGSPTGYTTYIINESGTVIHELDGVMSTYIVEVNGQYKLIAYKDDGFTKDVYGLPGTYNNGSVGMKPITYDQSELFPNPVQSVAKLSYSLPANVYSGQINIYNAAGVLVRKMPIGRAFDHVLVSRDDLPAGNYIYEITAPNYRSPSSKFTIL